MFDVKFSGKTGNDDFDGGVRFRVQVDREARDVKVVAYGDDPHVPAVDETLKPRDSMDHQIFKGNTAQITSDGSGRGITYQVEFNKGSVRDDRERRFEVSGGNLSEQLIATADNNLNDSKDPVVIIMNGTKYLVMQNSKVTVYSATQKKLSVSFIASGRHISYSLQAVYYKL